MDRHFHACFGRQRTQAAAFARAFSHSVSKCNRAGIAQRRVHACLVIPEQPGDGFILGLTDRFKALAVQPFHLQRAEQRLRAGVVPAVALAAHRRRDGILFEHLVEVVAGVLAAAIAMKDQLVVSIWTALEPGHLQGVDDQVAPHIGLHRPAHHTATEQIDHYGQKQPAFLGGNVGDVAGPRLVGRGQG